MNDLHDLHLTQPDDAIRYHGRRGRRFAHTYMIAVKAADMGAVIKIVKTDQRTGRRKTVGTVVFGA